MNNKPYPGTHLGNWRLSPYNRWSFQNVRELIPTARLSCRDPSKVLPQTNHENRPVENTDEQIVKQLEELETDSFTLYHHGQKQWQWSAQHCDITKPHIIFSISKSITAMLTGCLWEQGLLDTKETVSYYLAGAQKSAYADCTIQQLLDMQVSLDFVEDYSDPTGDYFYYRNATAWNPVDQTKVPVTLEPFLFDLQKGKIPHGQSFAYASPNSDLLGLLVERIASVPYAQLLSELIWQPMEAEQDGYITVDYALLARAAGGICVGIDDLAKFGHLLNNNGSIGTRSIVPESWVMDTRTAGSREAWTQGGFVNLFPNGKYRNKCYQLGDPDQCLLGLGIHGQWLYCNPSTGVVMVKFSCQADPVNEGTDVKTLKLIQSINEQFR